MSEKNSIIWFNPVTKKIDDSELCRHWCEHKERVLDKMQDILANPDYDPECEDWCTLSIPCEKDNRDRCYIEVKKKNNI